MNLKKKRFLSFLAGIVLLLVLAACGGGGSDDAGTDADNTDDSGDAAADDGDTRTVNLGGIWTITGPSGDTGTPYSEGQTHYFEYLESQGGIEGVKINFSGEDYGYEISDAQRTYQSFRDRDGVSAILGWGTGDTEAMREQVAADKIPYISASYSEALNNPSENPYNFFIAASYSDQGRMALNWIKENHDGDGNPTVALIYGDNGFGRSPIEDMKAYAEEIGVDHVGDFIVELDATEAQSQMLNMQKENPDYAIVQETWGATGVVLREAQTLGIETQFIGLNQAVGEGLIEQAGDVTEGFIGVLTHSLPYEDSEGMDEYKEYLDEKGIAVEDLNMQHVAGWVSAKVLAEAVRIAAENTDGEITGEEIHAALESMDNYDLGGLAAPVGFSADDHAGTDQARLGEIVDGKWEAFTDYIGP